VNRQIGVGDSKYLVIFYSLQAGHVTQRMRCVTCMLHGSLHRENAGLAWHSSDRTFTAKYIGNRERCPRHVTTDPEAQGRGPDMLKA